MTLDPLDPAERPSARPLLPLLLLFLLSGATSLLYEVLWMRRLTLVFGATQLAIATVLSAFMLGLALGAAVAGRLVDRRQDLLRIYGLLELGIGAYALLFPRWVAAATDLYRALFDADTATFWGSQLVHLVLMGALLLLPTAAMGATLPLLVRFVTERLSGLSTRAGLLYGVNTFGAVLGTWATGFILLPTLGVTRTERLAAAMNLLIGLVALGLARQARVRGLGAVVVDDRDDEDLSDPPRPRTPDPDFAPAALARLRRALLPVMAFGGACTMIYEVAWARFLTLVLGSSVYAFTTMLVAFLLGTAGGAVAGAAWVGRPGARPARAIGAALIGAGLAALGTSHLFRFMPFLYVDLFSLLDGVGPLFTIAEAGLALLIMAPATFCIGLLFPFATRLMATGATSVARDVARVYVANTLGAVVGSLLAGFVLIPMLGIRATVLFGITLNLLLGGTVLALRAGPLAVRLRQVVGVGVALAVALGLRPPWDPLLMTAGMYQYVSELADMSHEAVRNFALSDFEVLFYEEGRTSVVTVARSLGSGNLWLANNGKVDASTLDDLPTQVLLGHLPLLVRPEARSALVVGLASGITAGSVTLHPGLERIDVLEIEPAVITASHYFDAVNQRPLEDPRVRCIANDARNHLVLVDAPYDVIVNEPSNPWITGVSNLFTEEFLRLGRSKLAPGGVFAQWMQIYGMGREDLRSLLATFGAVFPHILLVSTGEEADIILLGSEAPLPLSLPAVERLLREAGPRADLLRIGVHEPFDLLTFVQFGEDGVRAIAGDAPHNTDDNVRIEFNAPRYLHYDTLEGNLELLAPASTGMAPLLRDQFVHLSEHRAFLFGLAAAYERRDLWLQAARTYQEALRLDPDNAEARDHLRSIQGLLRELNP